MTHAGEPSIFMSQTAIETRQQMECF